MREMFRRMSDDRAGGLEDADPENVLTGVVDISANWGRQCGRAPLGGSLQPQRVFASMPAIMASIRD